MRLDSFLAQQYPEYSRAILQKFIAAEYVKINGKIAKNPAQNINEIDKIEIDFPEKQTFENEIENFTKNVIYEDKNVVVANKPTGILTHMKGGIQDEFTVADFVKSRILAENKSSKSDNSNEENLNEKQNDFSEENNRAGIVHRLDRATSGVLISAKNPETSSILSRQFQDRKAHKTYLALTDKTPKISAARIDLPIARNSKKPAEFRIDASGKSAITNYKVLAHFENEKGEDLGALIELKPLTGRTHQLRVHLSYIDAPISGDIIYNEKAAKKFTKNNNLRMFLHAAKLEITIPKIDNEIENQRKTFSAKLPNDFLEEIKNRDKNFDFTLIQDFVK